MESAARSTPLRKRALLAQLLAERAGPVRSAPLSFAQERLWFLEQLHPGNTAYHLPIVLRLRDPLDAGVLERALNQVVARHEALRTTFAISGGVPVQRISSSLHVPLREIDVRSSADPAGDAQRTLEEDNAQPFDLQRGPLLRATLIHAIPGEATLVITMHHIVSDGWSCGVLVRELTACYDAFARNQAVSLAALPIQYADFAVWQREWLQGEVLAKEVAYWKNRLSDAPPLLDLPTDHPRPLVESHRGAFQTVVISARLVERLRGLAREHNATPFMVLLAIFQGLLTRTAGINDVVVASPSANRNRADLEPLIGFFVNMLPLRARITRELTVRGLIQHVREATLAAFDHQDLPFETLVEELRVRRSLSHSPVCQVAFVLQAATIGANLSGAVPAAAGCHAVSAPVDGTAKFDLTLSLLDGAGSLAGTCEYRTDLFDHITVTRLLRRYFHMLEAACDKQDARVWEIPLALNDEAALIVRPAPEVDATLVARAAKVAGPTGDTKALTAGATAVAIGASSASRIAAVEDNPALTLLARLTAAAAGATFVGVGKTPATHVFLTPRALAALPLDAVATDATLVVVGLPCFDSAFARWTGRRVVGVWGPSAGVASASLELIGREAVIASPLDGQRVEVLDERHQRQVVGLCGEIAIGALEKYRTGLVGRHREDGRMS